MIYVIIGPSAGGKTTLVKNSKLPKIVTSTTRSPRSGETEGVDYYFTDWKTFWSDIKNGKYLEYDEYADNMYGTSVQSIKDAIERGGDFYCVMTAKGAIAIKNKFPDQCLVIMVYASRYEVNSRLKERGESIREIDIRMNQYNYEMKSNWEICDVAINTTHQSPEKSLHIFNMIERLNK